MTDILSLIRSDLREVVGYSTAAAEAAGYTPSIKVDANENPWPPFGALAGMCNVNRYTEPQPTELRKRMAALWGVIHENILLTSGSSQAIDLLIRLCCMPGQDQIMICPPTFSMYEVYARIQGASVLAVSLKEDGQLDLDGIEQTATDNTKLIFIPTPNAPMGHAMSRDDILKLCNARTGKSLVIADEAYAEFSSSSQGLLSDLTQIPNLVILRTLSKAYALAGERVGCMIGPIALIQGMQRVIPPYPLAQSAVRAATDVLSPTGLAQAQMRIKTIVAERSRLSCALKKSSEILRVFPSEGNFVLLQTQNAASFLAHLRRYGIAARDMSAQRAETVRVSIGTETENDLLLTALNITPTEREFPARIFNLQRQTEETSIDVALNLDDPVIQDIQTGIGFLDHMLDQLAVHGGFGMTLRARGDLQVDAHHTIEDCALALGAALRGALGDKRGLARYGFTAPLDESIANVVLDLSGRTFFEMEATWPHPFGDGVSPDLITHFFRSLTTSLNATVHIKVRGENTHHMIEACFKAFGRALRQAMMRDGNAIPSTKGVI